MKRCPECGRDYNDDSLSFCLDDGAELLFGPSSFEEPQTAILSEPPASAGGQFGEAKTRPQIHTTAAEPQSKSGEPSETQSFSAHRAAKPQSGLDKRILLAPLVLAVIVLGGFFGYRYFSSSKSSQINSIAVLPFENRSGDPNAEYLSDGLTDSLIFRFSQLPDLRVSPTSSVMRYKGSPRDVADIAEELEVDGVLSGRLMQVGDNLSISVQLIDTRTKKLVWAEQYDRKMADLLATQREIATVLTQKMQLRLAGDEIGIAKKYTNSNDAYQLYLKGRFHYAKRTKDDLTTGIDYFEQAVTLDPSFALAYAMIADAYASMPAYPYAAPKDAMPKAKAAAARALEIDPMLPEAHSAMGYTLGFSNWNWAAAESSFERALELDPKNALAHLRFGIYSVATGQTAEAVKQTEIAAHLEPLNLVHIANLTWVLMADGRTAESLAQGKKTYDLERNFVLGRYQHGYALIASGMYTEAIALAEEILKNDLENQYMLHVAGYAYARSGRRDEATAIVERFHKIRERQYAISYMIATIHAGLDDRESAFSELGRAYQERDWRMTAHIKWDFMMEPLRRDSRFRDLLRRMNLPE